MSQLPLIGLPTEKAHIQDGECQRSRLPALSDDCFICYDRSRIILFFLEQWQEYLWESDCAGQQGCLADRVNL